MGLRRKSPEKPSQMAPNGRIEKREQGRDGARRLDQREEPRKGPNKGNSDLDRVFLP